MSVVVVVVVVVDVVVDVVVHVVIVGVVNFVFTSFIEFVSLLYLITNSSTYSKN